ncbi:hypothetical protein NWI01_03860 [Nitrobacter winogradskyi]|uniref:Uncharacterized protein n=1 Tax=Nitrobacter winogradskyi TaxID=913 RepID=A0A4Y3W681_NITWI|nr:hypothetical protein NWI01_03860 [Nitrobacter winogradskyi]
MPGLSGVTAPITPDSRTTGTTLVPRRHRLGMSFVSAVFTRLMAFSWVSAISSTIQFNRPINMHTVSIYEGQPPVAFMRQFVRTVPDSERGLQWT